jgi:two-component system OmpR family response regulator
MRRAAAMLTSAMASASARIIIVEDDPAVAAGLVRGLKLAGFEVELATDGTTGARLAMSDGVAAVLLDLMLPARSGFDVLALLQHRAAAPPVIVLSARTELGDRLRAFELGAIDFVPKPFWIEEVVARIRAHLPADEPRQPSRIVAWAGAAVNLDARTVTVNGAPVVLTRFELDLLAYLVQRPGRAIPRAQLASHAFGSLDERTDRTVDSHLARVRKKLGPAAAAITTVWGIGYRFDPAEDHEP